MSTAPLILKEVRDVIYEGRWFLCVRTPRLAGRKTDIYEIVSKEQGDVFATIQWYGRWRKYSLFPQPETVWEQTCLAEIATLLHRLTHDHRQHTARSRETTPC